MSGVLTIGNSPPVNAENLLAAGYGIIADLRNTVTGVVRPVTVSSFLAASAAVGILDLPLTVAMSAPPMSRHRQFERSRPGNASKRRPGISHPAARGSRVVPPLCK
jgi:hypothetical protein